MNWRSIKLFYCVCSVSPLQLLTLQANASFQPKTLTALHRRAGVFSFDSCCIHRVLRRVCYPVWENPPANTVSINCVCCAWGERSAKWVSLLCRRLRWFSNSGQRRTLLAVPRPFTKRLTVSSAPRISVFSHLIELSSPWFPLEVSCYLYPQRLPVFLSFTWPSCPGVFVQACSRGAPKGDRQGSSESRDHGPCRMVSTVFDTSASACTHLSLVDPWLLLLCLAVKHWGVFKDFTFKTDSLCRVYSQDKVHYSAIVLGSLFMYGQATCTFVYHATGIVMHTHNKTQQ